jgi:type IV fimbrial biogenesis protein FimT
MKREKGFTLIELLTTIGIGAALVAMAVPSMQSVVMNSKQRSGVNELISAMYLARNTAITTNSRVTLCASSNGSACEAVAWNDGWIVFADLDSDQSVDADEVVLRAGSKADGLDIHSSQFSRFLMYRPSGRVMNASTANNVGEFSICDGRGPEYVRIVAIDLSGRPRVSEYSTLGLTPSCY